MTNSQKLELAHDVVDRLHKDQSLGKEKYELSYAEIDALRVLDHAYRTEVYHR